MARISAARSYAAGTPIYSQTDHRRNSSAECSAAFEKEKSFLERDTEMLKKVKDKLYYYLAEKNWGVRREYGPYVESHQEEHAKTPWKHWWMLLQLNWHYRILRRKDTLYYAKPDRSSKRRLP